MAIPDSSPAPTSTGSVGRYQLYDELATGGMGSVYLGRMKGPAGFGRMVAVKRLHAHLAREESFRNAFVDEARLASRVVHPNVVQTLDVVATERELFLVMELVLGEPLVTLWNACRGTDHPLPRAVALGLASQVLQGLHAAHEALDEQGRPLGIIHRDVSPQNVLVGVDGVARLLDFGVAKANGRLQTTEDGVVKGKFAYMAPEHITGAKLDRRADVYSASVLLWELLTGERVFDTADKTQIMFLAAQGAVRRPTAVAPDLPAALEDIVMKGLERDPERRFATAHEMALALEAADRCANPLEIAAFLATVPSAKLEERRQLVARVEATGAAAIDDANDAVAMSARVPVPSRRRSVGLAVGGVLVVATLAGAAVFVTRPSSTTASSPESSGSAAAAPPPVSAAAPASAPTTALASPSASASVAAVAPTHAPTHGPAPATPPRGTARPTARPTATATTKPGDGLFPRN